MKYSIRIITIAVGLLVVLAGTCRAQYEMPHEYSPQEARYVSAGAMLRNFAPRGGYTGGDSAAITYNAWMPMLGYHHGLVDMQFGYTRYTLKGVTCSAVFFGVTASNDLPVLRETASSLVVPMILSVDYTKSESAGGGRKQFIVGSLGLGTGLKGRLVGSGVEFTAHVTAAYHYSFEGFDTGSGSSLAAAGEAALLLRTIHIVDGIVVGYRFRHQLWTLGDGRLNYRVNTHGPFVGVLL